MTIVLIILFIFTIITSKPVKYNEDYLSKRYTNIIKGIFLIFVFIKHFISYKIPFQDNWIDSIGITLLNKMGQLIVTLFLFYSGYGVMESIKNKGENYIKTFPKKRILTTLINFDIAVLIYMFASKYFINHPFSISKLLLSLIGWDTFGNSNWYIFAIIILYFITYLSVKSFKNRNHQVISIFIGTLLYTVLLSFYKETYWYNTAFCFVFGVAYSAYKENLEKWILGKEWLLIIYFLALYVISYLLKANMVWYHIYTIAFTAIIVLFTRKIQIKNAILQWVGKNLFPMYIFQRLPMMLLKDIDYFKNNTYIFFITALIITVLITFIYNFVIWTKNKITNINRKEEAK